MPRETSNNGTGAQIPPHQSKLIPTDIDYPPTNENQGNNTDNVQVDPKEHLTWDHEDTYKIHEPYFRFIFIYSTTYPSSTKMMSKPSSHS